jgi:phasin family protein
MMFAVPEDMSALQKASVDSVMKFADAASQAAEQWFDLNVRSAKAASAEITKQVRALAAAKDVQELASLQTSFSQANAEKVMGFSKAVYTWASETQGQIAKLVEGQMAEINKSVNVAIEKAAKSAPAGTEFAFSAVKTAVAATNQAYETLSKAGKQVAEMTESTITTATEGAVAPKKKAA